MKWKWAEMTQSIWSAGASHSRPDVGIYVLVIKITPKCLTIDEYFDNIAYVKQVVENVYKMWGLFIQMRLLVPISEDAMYPCEVDVSEATHTTSSKYDQRLSPRVVINRLTLRMRRRKWAIITDVSCLSQLFFQL